MVMLLLTEQERKYKHGKKEKKKDIGSAAVIYHITYGSGWM